MTNVTPPPAFAAFGLSEAVLKGVIAAGFVEPSPVQAETIPAILEGKDLIALARTGTGKTAAFGLPALTRMDPKSRAVQCLVITPTRELASQVSDEMFRLGNIAGFRSVCVVGGQSGYRQVDLIGRGAQIVVATPGRLRDLLDSKRLRDFAPSIVVLDEADEMLDMGFLEDLEAILAHLPAKRQTLLFSATMPAPIARLAERFLHNPKKVDLTGGGTVTTDIRQHAVVVQDHERFEAVARILDGIDNGKCIVFCRTKIETSDLATMLSSRGMAARALHGDIEQDERTRTLKSFRADHCTVLVATDVAARGLDVGGVSHVINCHLPFDHESYVHRIGRTGRAGKTGIAITLVTPREFHALRRFKQTLRATVLPAEVPTLTELSKRDARRLADAAKSTEIDPVAIEIVAALTAADLDPVEAAIRLASMLMSKHKRSGPDRVGMKADVTERLLADKPRSDGPPRGKPGYAGKRGGSYGGYRGASTRDGDRGGNRGGESDQRGGSYGKRRPPPRGPRRDD